MEVGRFEENLANDSLNNLVVDMLCDAMGFYWYYNGKVVKAITQRKSPLKLRVY